MNVQSLAATADWHADRALEGYRKGHYQLYKRHTHIQDAIRGVIGARTQATKADLGRLSSKFKVKP